MSDKFVLRKVDNAVFEPSYADTYNEAIAIKECLSGECFWFFRRIAPVPRRWWHVGRYWKRTGEIWQPRQGAEFDVITPDEAWRITNAK